VKLLDRRPGLRVYIRDGGFFFVLTDEADELILAESRWRVNGKGYATSLSGVPLHRAIVGLQPGDSRPVHHANEIKVDNRRSNLVICADGTEHAALHPGPRGMGPTREALLDYLGEVGTRYVMAYQRGELGDELRETLARRKAAA
jgi:hypothetical protein